MVPYLDGERTPNRPGATGLVYGLRPATSTPAHLARATMEGVLCGLADALEALLAHGTRLERLLLVGGGARSEAIRRIAPTVLGRPVIVPAPGEYAADGAARQAAWALSPGATPPDWGTGAEEVSKADPVPTIRARYAEVRDRTARPDRHPHARAANTAEWGSLEGSSRNHDLSS